MTAGNEERNVIRQQFARFASQCRTFAPLYRQVTLAACAPRWPAAAGARSRRCGYDDVLDAWNHYLKNDNGGRGVVLIAHSQGSFMLTRLIARGDRRQAGAVAAGLGDSARHQHSRAERQGRRRCVPEDSAVPQPDADRLSDHLRVVPIHAAAAGQHARSAASTGEGMESACTNPAALGGGSGELHAYLTGAGSLIASAAPQKHQWVRAARAIDTPFVSVPGLLTAKCATNENGSYLELTVKGDPADPRADDIPGDLGMIGRVQANWGMHLVDVNIAMGNLVDIVRQAVEGVQEVGAGVPGAGARCRCRVHGAWVRGVPTAECRKWRSRRRCA